MRPVAAVVIGASAGAVEALSSILPHLPRHCPFPLIVVVHLPPDRKSLIVEVFRSKCRIEVKEAEDKEPLRDGVVYFAPPDYHLLVEPDRRLSLSYDEPVLFSRPSIDVLFESAADAFGKDLLGIVLSGANADGARGLGAICAAGGVGLIQNPETAYCATMPQAAREACPDARTLNGEEIAAYLCDLAAGRDD